MQNNQTEITKDEVQSAIKTQMHTNAMIQLFLQMKFSNQGVTHFSVQLQMFKEEMYIMSSYYKYTTILNSSFNKINSYTAHHYWEKVSKILHAFRLYFRLPAIMNLIFRTVR